MCCNELLSQLLWGSPGLGSARELGEAYSCSRRWMSAMYCKRHACKTQCVENFLVALVAVEGCESVLTGTLVGNNSVMGGDR